MVSSPVIEMLGPATRQIRWPGQGGAVNLSLASYSPSYSTECKEREWELQKEVSELGMGIGSPTSEDRRPRRAFLCGQTGV